MRKIGLLLLALSALTLALPVAAAGRAKAAGGVAPDIPKPALAKGTYTVTAKPSLMLRDTADVKGRKLLAIPYGSVVEVLSATQNHAVINGRSGHWANVKWQEQQGFVFDAYLAPAKPLPVSSGVSSGPVTPAKPVFGNTPAVKPPASNTLPDKPAPLPMHTLEGVIHSYECGDNCYLTITDTQGEDHAGLCSATLCSRWNAVAAMPERFKGKAVTVTVGTGTQYDAEGNVMGQMDAFMDIRLH